MSKYKVCVYAISKNESQFVDRWMDAVGEADLVVVVDTGSTDDTVEKLRARGALVFEEKIQPWRFDEARNRSMDHVPEDVDICVCNDIDEVFAPGWREKLEQAWKPQYTRARYWYAWAPAEVGKPVKRFPTEKMHRRHGFRWVHPVHEVLEYSGTDPEESVFIDDLFLDHLPDPHKSRGQYLPLLELSAQENPDDDRTMFWLGREYIFYGKNDDGIRTLEHHLTMPSAVWPEERSASMRFIARAYRAKQEPGEAERWLLRAAAECPGIREPWLELAQLGYDRSDWNTSFYAACRGIAITQSTNSYLVEPAAWGYLLYDLGAIAAYQLGLYATAAEFATNACVLDPENERLTNNLRIITEKCREVGGLAQA
ncbi:MAG: glycosyl transferase family 2 [Oscillospiraceae bacterium]|nr:glycosyl transferase family 2 [Oscillospiraceae bacterium]